MEEKFGKILQKKKQEQALLDLTPTSSLSETENSFGNEENNRQELDTNNESLNRTPAEESLDLTGPIEASTPQRTRPVIKKRERASRTVAKLRAKLRFYVPSIRFPGERVWYYRQDIRDIIPEPLPVTSSARHFCILPDIWAKHKKRS